MDSSNNSSKKVAAVDDFEGINSRLPNYVPIVRQEKVLGYIKVRGAVTEGVSRYFNLPDGAMLCLMGISFDFKKIGLDARGASDAEVQTLLSTNWLEE